MTERLFIQTSTTGRPINRTRKPDATANVAVATTGILGPEDFDGIPAGTICFAWAFQSQEQCRVFSHEHRFSGTRCQVQTAATEYALKRLPDFHRRALTESE